MHSALLVNEIRLAICKAVALDLQQGRRTLTILARISSLFHDPVLDMLWSRLDPPEPLYMLFPPEVIHGVEDDEKGGRYFVSHGAFTVTSYSS